MKMRRRAGSTLTGLISLVIVYVIIIILVLVLASQVVSDIPRARELPVTFIVILAILFSLVLIGIIVVNVIRLIREKAAGRPGVNFKFRLFMFFFLIVILSSVPQAFLSINFINSAMHAWFGTRVGEALRGGLSIAIETYNDSIRNLEEFTEGRLFGSVLADLDRNPQRSWENVKSLNPEIDSMQVFNTGFEELFYAGRVEDGTRLTRSQATESQEGLVIKDATEESSFLRIRKTVELSQGTYYVILSSILPKGFDESAGRLTDSIERMTQLERLQTNFMFAVIVFYSFFSFPLLLLSILVSFLLAEEIIRPIVQLEDATRRVAEGDFSIRILSRSRDDLSLLVSSFNSMVNELEHTRLKILQTEKVAAWQEIAQQLAHEIKNPLTPIKLSAERLLRKFRQNPDSLKDVLENAVSAIIAEVDSLNTLLTEFRHFSRLPEPHLERLQLYDLVKDAAGLYSRESGEVRIKYDDLDRDIFITADPVQLKQVFANLFKNAVEAIEGGGSVFVRADLVKKGNKGYCRIQIQDTGSGIEEKHHSSVFNPYFTTKQHGTGLGLAIVERIVFDHKGQIWFETEKNAGTTFFIDIPMEPEE
jgi:nitrogen fixation/metabolism regulation signal transduction histidine kinase